LFHRRINKKIALLFCFMFSAVVAITWHGAYLYSTTKTNYDDARMPINSTLLSNVKIDFDMHKHSEGFMTHEMMTMTAFRELTGTPYKASDFYISAPNEYPMFYRVLTESILDKKNKEYRKASDILAGNGGVFSIVKKSAQQDNLMVIDDKIVSLLAQVYGIKPYVLIQYAHEMPLNHEAGHAYLNAENYNHDNFNLYSGFMAAISEYSAEYTAITGTYSDMLKDDRIDDKELAYQALLSLFSMSRFLTVSLPHIGAAIAVCSAMTNNEGVIKRDAKILSYGTTTNSTMREIDNDLLSPEPARLTRIDAIGMTETPYGKNTSRRCVKLLKNRVVKDVIRMSLLS